MIHVHLQVGEDRVPLEVSLLHILRNSPGIVKLVDYFERVDSFIIIMERPEPCKDLFDFITEKGVLEEQLARNFFRQVIHKIYIISVHSIAFFLAGCRICDSLSQSGNHSPRYQG